jgi:hypothetical protein
MEDGMKITLKWLKEQDACQLQVSLFKERFGDSVEVTRELMIDQASDLKLSWLATKILTSAKLSDYEELHTTILAELEEALDLIFTVYQKARTTLLADYEKAIAPILADALGLE